MDIGNLEKAIRAVLSHRVNAERLGALYGEPDAPVGELIERGAAELATPEMLERVERELAHVPTIQLQDPVDRSLVADYGRMMEHDGQNRWEPFFEPLHPARAACAFQEAGDMNCLGHMGRQRRIENFVGEDGSAFAVLSQVLWYQGLWIIFRHKLPEPAWSLGRFPAAGRFANFWLRAPMSIA